MKIRAFTLAETLITLGIIGIVAAMTMPVLIGNYKKNVLKNQFKKAYNTLQNAYQQAEVQLGYHPLCYYEDNPSSNNPYNRSTDCRAFSKELSKVLQVIKICNGNGVQDGCIPPYKGIDTIYKNKHEDVDDDTLNEMFRGAPGWKENSIQTQNPIWVLSDGTIIIWYVNTSTGGSNTAIASQLLAVDINGIKGPNKWGYDVFAFIVKSSPTQPLLLKNYNLFMIEDGGMTVNEMLQN